MKKGKITYLSNAATEKEKSLELLTTFPLKS